MIDDDVARLPPREEPAGSGFKARGSHGATDTRMFLGWHNNFAAQHHPGVGRVHPRARAGTVEMMEHGSSGDGGGGGGDGR